MSVAFLLVRWFGLVLVRFLRPRFFRSCRLALSSGAIRQTPLSPKERRGTDYGKGDDHDAGDGHDAGDNHDADPFFLWIAWSFGLFEGALKIAYFLFRYMTSIFFFIFLS